jgi:hypothetical protein
MVRAFRSSETPEPPCADASLSKRDHAASARAQRLDGRFVRIVGRREDIGEALHLGRRRAHAECRRTFDLRVRVGGIGVPPLVLQQLRVAEHPLVIRRVLRKIPDEIFGNRKKAASRLRARLRAKHAFGGTELEIGGFGRERAFGRRRKVRAQLAFGVGEPTETEVADAEPLVHLVGVASRIRIARAGDALVRLGRFVEFFCSREVLRRDPLGRDGRAEHGPRILEARDGHLRHALRVRRSERRELRGERRRFAAHAFAAAARRKRGDQRVEAKHADLIERGRRHAAALRFGQKLLRFRKRRGSAGRRANLAHRHARRPVERGSLGLLQNGLEVSVGFLAASELGFGHAAAEQALEAHLLVRRGDEFGELAKRLLEPLLAFGGFAGAQHRHAVMQPRELAGGHQREAAIELPPSLLVQDLGIAVVADDVGLRLVDASLVKASQPFEQRKDRAAERKRDAPALLAAGSHPCVVRIRNLNRRVGELAEQRLFGLLAEIAGDRAIDVARHLRNGRRTSRQRRHRDQHQAAERGDQEPAENLPTSFRHCGPNAATSSVSVRSVASLTSISSPPPALAKRR